MRSSWALIGLVAACGSRPPTETVPQSAQSVVRSEPDEAPAPASVQPPAPEPPTPTDPPPPRFGRTDVLPVERCQVKLPAKIQFETNRATLHKQSEPVLKALLETVKAYPDERFRIEGHATEQSNYALKPSERRAKSVLRYLVEYGISRTRLRAIGYGMDRPLVPNDTPEHRAVNRRIEVVVEDCEPSAVD